MRGVNGGQAGEVDKVADFSTTSWRPPIPNRNCREKRTKNIVSYEKRLKVIINVKKEKEKYSNYKIRIKNSLLKTINFTINYLLKYMCAI